MPYIKSHWELFHGVTPGGINSFVDLASSLKDF